MATISFKSVGRTSTTTSQEKVVTTVLPVGIKTPLQKGTKGEGIFAVHYDLGDQIKDNLRNLLLTNWGERLCLYDFGANLKELTTEFTSRDDFDNEAMNRIKNAVNRWMSYVSLSDFSSNAENIDNSKTGIIVIKVTYDIPMLNLINQSLEILLYVI